MTTSYISPLATLRTLLPDATFSLDRWNGFERVSFDFQNRASHLVLPPEPLPGNPWLWRPTFFDAWPSADIALIQKGFHLAYTEVLADYASPTGIRHGKAFHDLLVRAGLAAKFTFVALSRGGLYAFRYAESHPEEVAAIYADAPVCDFSSWPGGQGKSARATAEFNQVLHSHGLTEAEILSPKFQPLNRLEPLAQHHIPLIHVCGDADDVVPLDENTRVLEKNYRQLGGTIEVIIKPGIGHHPHGLEDPTPVVNFITKHVLEIS
ncbi:MAG: hypothetical protein B9S32_14420 [Verrucomicrobia bacterium Tous-C9LFEB]|nr:MAG: hypothetical protein B9S32_14420 [Verrucomicrobia bacterium Tous-C9LFEB]